MCRLDWGGQNGILEHIQLKFCDCYEIFWLDICCSMSSEDNQIKDSGCDEV